MLWAPEDAHPSQGCFSPRRDEGRGGQPGTMWKENVPWVETGALPRTVHTPSATEIGHSRGGIQSSDSQSGTPWTEDADANVFPPPHPVPGVEPPGRCAPAYVLCVLLWGPLVGRFALAFPVVMPPWI